GSFVNPTTPIR
nr:RecName: Full=Monocopper oxidase-like protein 1 [Zinnia elegans]